MAALDGGLDHEEGGCCLREAGIGGAVHSLPPPLICRAGQDLDSMAHLPFLRRCEDLDEGLKLSIQ
jgi:xyloglucan fucosyltransferase